MSPTAAGARLALEVHLHSIVGHVLAGCLLVPYISRIPVSCFYDLKDYPVWNADNATTGASIGPLGTYFRPREADATIQNPGMSPNPQQARSRGALIIHNSSTGPTLSLFPFARGRLVLEEGPQLLERQHLVGPHHFDHRYARVEGMFSVGVRRISWSKSVD